MKKGFAIGLAVLFFIVIMVIHHAPLFEEEDTTETGEVFEEEDTTETGEVFEESSSKTETDTQDNDEITSAQSTENDGVESGSKEDGEVGSASETETNSEITEEPSDTESDGDGSSETNTEAETETETETDKSSADLGENAGGESGSACRHTDERDENGFCDVCGIKINVGNMGGGSADLNSGDLTVLAIFEFGQNGEAKHTDGGEMNKQTSSYTVGEIYTLTFTKFERVYKNARDAKGNSALKLGTKGDPATLEFSVPQDVMGVIIRVAKYKDDDSVILVNGVTYTLTKNSDDGEYNLIFIDTSSNKSISISTDTGNSTQRCMINSIEYLK